MALKIEKLFAWIAVGKEGGDEGVMGGRIGEDEMVVMFAGADRARVESLRPYVMHAIKVCKPHSVVLAEFKVRKTREIIK